MDGVVFGVHAWAEGVVTKGEVPAVEVVEDAAE